jgi:hypothetical protein
VIEIIQYVKGRCCCGKIDLAPENEDVIHNDTVHQLLGPEGNFCGPTHLHTIKNLESRVREIEAERGEYKKQADGYYQEAATAYETRNKAIELLSERYTNLNRDGKTILDFQNTWIRQTRDENDKLRSERDRLKEENKRLLFDTKFLEESIKDNLKLRARHAALVEKVNKIFNCYKPGFISPELLEELKDALAEVK